MKRSQLESPFFTVFTPVYNAEKHIHKVFDSISNQIYKNFEWIIINDGSTDNSAALIKSFMENHPEIDITYLEQNNSGKHIAWNRAVRLARGKLFVPADHDDAFMHDALSFFYKSWNALTHDEQSAISGINVLCQDEDSGDILGPSFPVDGMITTNLELVYKYKIIKGEKWGCVRVDLLKNRPFPEIKGPMFPENYIWLYLSKNYKVICFNKPLRKYYNTVTSITQSVKNKWKQNPAHARVKLKYNLWFIRNFGMYVLFHSPKELLRYIVSTVLQLIIIIKRKA